MGGACAVLAAAEEPAIGALVTDSAFGSFEQMMERQYAKLARLPHCFLPGALLLGRVLLHGLDVRRVQPLHAMPRLRGRPVLVIHSLGDRFVPASDAQALAQACGAECWRTHSDGHIGSYRAQPLVYAERVTQFFARHLDALPPVQSAQPVAPRSAVRQEVDLQAT
jgi:fermentation-respiration switch protein FrsA (DUF1100 family)